MRIVLEQWSTGGYNSPGGREGHSKVHYGHDIRNGSLPARVVHNLLVDGKYYDRETNHNYIIYQMSNGLED